MSSPTPVEKHQLVTHDGELSSESLSAYLDTLGARDWNRAYQVVAIMGPQSSGKSTLVNHVFGTSFQEMNHELGRSQTTRGVWIARANRPETFPTIVMDLEGTDGRERGEDDTAFEKQTALFAMATADVLLVNMWCQDIGREVASGKPLLKTIFQVNLKVFNPRKTTLVFVIRDKSRTPLERLRENLREDLDRIWAGITKPDRLRDAAFDDFFRLEFVALAHYEHAHEQFLAETAALTRRFESPPNASEDSLRPPGEGASVPSAGLAVSFAEAWRAVRENRDLDLPAHRVMVATVRCEEIATSRIAAMRASPELADASRAVDESDAAAAAAARSGLAASLSSLADAALESYDDEARFFDASVRAAKREQLRAKTVATLRPVISARLAKASAGAVAALTSKIAGEGSKDASSFADVVASALAESRERWAKILADAVPRDEDVVMTGGDDDESGSRESPGVASPGFVSAKAAAAKAAAEDDAARLAASGEASWATVAADATETHEKSVTAAIDAERADRARDATRAAERAVERVVGSAMTGLFDEFPADVWDRVDAAVATAAKKHRANLAATLDGLALDATEASKTLAVMTTRAWETADAKSRAAADAAPEMMKAAFARVFSKDSNGLPKTWRADSDVAAQCRRGHVEALRVLGLLAVSGVRARATWGDDPDGSGVRDDAFVSRFETTRAFVDDALASFLPVGTGADAAGADAEGADSDAPRADGVTADSSASTFPSEWPGVDDDRVLLDPGACRAAWRKFEDETAYAVSQALAAKEAAARGGHPAAPFWMYAALVVTGFDEVMWLLRNPVTLLFLVALAAFLRAMYKNMDVETAMKMGFVPGIMFLATKVVPTAVAIFKRLLDEGNESQSRTGTGGTAQPPAATTPSGRAGDRDDKVYAPSVSGEGVQRRAGKTSAMMYPGGGE